MAKSKPIVNVAPEPDASQVIPGVWWVGRGPWGGLPALVPTGSNVWLIRGSEFDVLVDVGQGGPLAPLEKRIRQAGGDPGRVRQIWITHSHWDHSGSAAAWLAKYRQARCVMSAVGVEFLRRGDLRLTGAAMTHGYQFPIPPRLTAVRAGDVLECPPYRFRVVELPGHTPDCVAFRGRMSGLDVMFTGDAIIGDQAHVKGCFGWLDGLWLSDVHTYERTLAKAVTTPPDLILPGHGVPHYGPAARRSLRHCLWRIRKFLALPDPGHYGPFCAPGTQAKEWKKKM